MTTGQRSEEPVLALADLVRSYLARPNVVACNRALQAVHHELGQVWPTLTAQMKPVLQRWTSSTPSRGYEPWLVRRGVDPTLARIMAGIIIRRGERISKEGPRYPKVISAIRFLAKPGHTRQAITRRVAALLAAWEEKSIIETIFDGAGKTEFEFIRVLEAVAAGRDGQCETLMAIAADIEPHPKGQRGPKISAASAAHEFFLQLPVKEFDPRAYTWDDLTGEFTDPVTQATRREFNDPDFDPRPAHRRLKTQPNR
jgi:hypothetical protein